MVVVIGGFLSHKVRFWAILLYLIANSGDIQKHLTFTEVSCKNFTLINKMIEKYHITNL